MHRRSETAACAVRIGNKSNRGVKPTRNFRRAAFQGRRVSPVEQPHHALDQRYISIATNAAEQIAHIRFTSHPAIKIVAGPP